MEGITDDTSELLSLRLQSKTLQRINKLGEITKTNNRAQLVASSVRLADELVEIIRGGSKIYIEKPDGTKELVSIFGL